MADFLNGNIGTIVVLLFVSAVVFSIIVKQIKDKKKGKSSCGCNCGCCPNSVLCNKDK